MAEKQRLIDANAVAQAVRDNNRENFARQDWTSKDVCTLLENAPTVDAAEVVHGRWIGTRYDGYADGCPVLDLWECSECGVEYESEGDPPAYNYCPNCGAKMESEHHD